MPQPALSVIIPCYNVGPFVADCLRSVLRQPEAGRLEVLVVDDGSDDDTSAKVTAEFAAHPLVDCRLVRQSNQGLSSVRNLGLQMARGAYIAFLDGDDVWLPDYLACVLPHVLEGAAQVIAYNAMVVDVDGRRIKGLVVHGVASREAPQTRDEIALDAAAIGQWMSCTRVYRADLLQGLRFPLGRYYEDSAVVPTLYARATQIRNLPDELYAYRKRPGSITYSITGKHVDDLLLNIRETTARLPEAPAFWGTVQRNMILQLALEIGRAPRALRRVLLARAWPEVASTTGPGFRLRWLLRFLDVSLRSNIKQLLGIEPGVKAGGSVAAGTTASR